jgi:hypothetical protein
MSNGQDPSTQPASPYTRAYWPHPSALKPSPHNFSPPCAHALVPPLAASIPDKLALPPPLVALPGAHRLGHTVCIATHCNACTAALCHHNAQSSPFAAKLVHYMSRAAWPRLPCARCLARPSHVVGSCTAATTMRRQAQGDKAPAPELPIRVPVPLGAALTAIALPRCHPACAASEWARHTHGLPHHVQATKKSLP